MSEPVPPQSTSVSDSLELGAVILAGGKSRRLGQNKAELVFRGKTFLERIYQSVSIVCRPVVVVGPVAPIDGLPPDATVLVDEVPGRGPLEGIRVGLKYLEPECDYAFVACCDSPLLKPEVIRWLYGQRDSAQAVMPWRGSHRYGMTAIYETGLHRLIESMMAHGERKVRAITDACETKLLPIEDLQQVDPRLDSLINVNTVEDYQRLLDRP